jgi:methanogenic corrinoid protein MtbC1
MAGLNDDDGSDFRHHHEQGREQGVADTGREARAVDRKADRDDAERRIAGLVRTIEGEIIPRLMLAHTAKSFDHGRASGEAGSAISAAQVDALVRQIMSSETDTALAFVRELAASGASLESIYLDLLAPAAREMGRLWEDDRCSFTDVAVGLWRLQEIMHEIGMATVSPLRTPEPPHRVLLRQTPGENHSFGLNMVSEFFRRAGWQVHDDSSEAGTDPVANVRGRWFDVVGLSLSSERHLDVLATTIRGIRKASRNRGVGVMVGGPLFIEHPDWVARVGADTTASDGRQAVLQAQSMIELLARCG